MAVSILKLKQHSILPFMAVLSSFLLLSGEFFNCCCVTELYFKGVSHLVSGATSPVKEPKTQLESNVEEHHSHCPGHPSKTLASASPSTQDLSGRNGLKTNNSCFSESSLADKAMVIRELNPSLYSPALILSLVVKNTSFLRMSRPLPRPQNKSSPPLYLLNLRIVV